MFESKFEKRMRRVKTISIFIIAFMLGGWLERDYGVYSIFISWAIKHEHVFEWIFILLAILFGILTVIVIIYVEVRRYMLKKRGGINERRNKGEN